MLCHLGTVSGETHAKITTQSVVNHGAKWCSQRVDAARDELLEALAAQERRSKTEVVKMAIEERAAKADKSARTHAIFERIMQEDSELLDALSKCLSIWNPPTLRISSCWWVSPSRPEPSAVCPRRTTACVRR